MSFSKPEPNCPTTLSDLRIKPLGYADLTNPASGPLDALSCTVGVRS